ncbi:MAG TPA: sulfate adenylyltransferase [bacterium]|nr:sulfate adenylyltransferase [bacterium]
MSFADSNNLVPPHGGKLVCLLVNDKEKQERLKEAESFIKVSLSSLEVSDLVMLAIGAFSPLQGFMGKEDYERVVKEMRLKNGIVWPIPITLSTSKENASQIKEGQEISLIDPERNEITATMSVHEKYTYNKKREASYVFGTDDEKHTGVKKVYSQGDIYLGGPIEVLSEGGYPERFPEYARPKETRALFTEKGWKSIAAFQTRNPIHRSHEYLTKIALEVCDGLFIHPIVGKLKPGDIPAEVRMECYKTLLDKYYPGDRVLLKVYPMEMRYGGPREAVLHAIIRQNFGCSHLIVGRDHAGVGDYYGPFDAQKIFEQFNSEDLHIKPLKADWIFWCYKCESMASKKTCPHPDKDHLIISGTKLRGMLSQGKRPPKEFSRPEVIDILVSYYSSKNRGGNK